MVQSTITQFFKKETKNTQYVKKEIQIDWDVADNLYGQPYYSTARVVLEKLPEEVVQKYRNKKNNDSVKVRENFVKNCSKCKKKFTKLNGFLGHKSICGKERNFQCAHCPYKCRQKMTLIVHLSKIHPNGKNMGKRKHDDVDKFTKICQNCGKSAETLFLTKCETCFGQFFYQCNGCDKQFKTKSLADYHYSTRCGVKGYFNCPKCDFKSVWRSKVVHHMKQLHLIPESSQDFKDIKWLSLCHDNEKADSNIFQCPKCTKIMENSSKLSLHILICGGSNSKPSERDRRFVESDRGKALSTQIKCSNCEKQFNHVYSLNVHVRYCKKNEYMIKVTKDSSDIEVVDTDEDLPPKTLISADERNKRYTKMIVKYCNKCDKDIALEEKNWGVGRNGSCSKCQTTLLFKCKKCLKEYSKLGNLKIHLDMVCDPKEEFKCIKCSYTSNCHNRVKAHYNEVHGNDNAVCKKCGRKFKSIVYLKRHSSRCEVKPKYHCEHCPFKAKIRANLIRHIFCLHMEPIVIDRNEAIKMAKQRFISAKIHLKAHCSKCKREQRLDDRLKICKKCKIKLFFKCKICKKNYDVDDASACEHVIAYLGMIKFECKRCSKGTPSKNALWMHEKNCGVKASFKCRFCKYTSKLKGNMKKHEKVKHPHEFEMEG